MSINLISFPPFGYDSWLSHCGLSFSFFSLFCSLLYLWKWLFKFVICFKESISRSLDHRPVTAYHLSLFLFLFFSFSSSFFFFLLFFSFFSSSFTFFFVQLEKKKRSFFSSLAVLVLDQSQGGLENSSRHAEDSLDRPLFVFIFQKDFAFVLQFFFLLLS